MYKNRTKSPVTILLTVSRVPYSASRRYGLNGANGWSASGNVLEAAGSNISIISRCSSSFHFAALVRLRGTWNVDSEIEEMKLEARADSAESQMSFFQIFRDRSIRWQMYTVCVIQIGQPLTGINAVTISFVVRLLSQTDF